MMRRWFELAVVVALLGVGRFGAEPAEATIITFTDRAAWEAAVTGTIIEEDFNAFTSDTFIPKYPDTHEFDSFTFQRLGFISDAFNSEFNFIDVPPFFVPNPADPAKDHNIDDSPYFRGGGCL